VNNKLTLLIAVACGVILGSLLFRHTSLPPVPRIVTQYDTVRQIDTLWLTKLKHDTVQKVNIVERVIRTPAETIYKVPNLVGLEALQIGEKRGDSTLAYGFLLQATDSAYTLSHWQYQYWTPGPLRSLRVTPTGAPAIVFDDPPPQCDLKCKAHWGAGFVATVELLRLIFGHP